MANNSSKQQLWQSRIEECRNSLMSAKQWRQENQAACPTYLYRARKIRSAAAPEQKVFPEPDQKPETRNWMWVYMPDGNSDGPRMVLFQYERTRGGYHPKEFLEGYSGYPTTDGCQSCHGLPEDIRESGCMAHSRRRFEECLG